jgi:hypothetical protein
MDEHDRHAERFEENRTHLRAPSVTRRPNPGRECAGMPENPKSR